MYRMSIASRRCLVSVDIYPMIRKVVESKLELWKKAPPSRYQVISFDLGARLAVQRRVVDIRLVDKASPASLPVMAVCLGKDA